VKLFNLAQRLRDPLALWLVLRDPRTPPRVRVLIVGVVVLMCVYIISPIDILPDYIPLAGWLDDVLLVPLGFYLMQRVVPRPLLEEKRNTLASGTSKVVWKTGLIVLGVLTLWLALMATGGFFLYRAIVG
jgi:uncharacterized membrane protein YkvA (DUF1232 family)